MGRSRVQRCRRREGRQGSARAAAKGRTTSRICSSCNAHIGEDLLAVAPPFVRNSNLGVVGLDGAKGEVLSRCLNQGEQQRSSVGRHLQLTAVQVQTCMSHMRLNSDDLPTLGKPTIPIFRLLLTRPKRLADFCALGAAPLGGILQYLLQSSHQLLFICSSCPLDCVTGAQPASPNAPEAPSATQSVARRCPTSRPPPL